jgi:hypothetical protein
MEADADEETRVIMSCWDYAIDDGGTVHKGQQRW